MFPGRCNDCRRRWDAFSLLGLVPGFDVDQYGLAALIGVDPVEADGSAGRLVHAYLLEPRGADRFAMHELLRVYSAETAESHSCPHRTAGLDLQEQAWRVTEQAGETWPLGTIREGLALALIGLGRYEDALAQAEEAVATYRSFAQIVYRLRAYATVGAALHGLGRHAEAIDHLNEAVELCRELSGRTPAAQVLNTLGEIHGRSGNHAAARTNHEDALEFAEQARNRRERARALLGLGDAHAALAELGHARDCWARAFDEYTDMGLPVAARVAARLRGLPN